MVEMHSLIETVNIKSKPQCARAPRRKPTYRIVNECVRRRMHTHTHVRSHSHFSISIFLLAIHFMKRIKLLMLFMTKRCA